MNALENETNLTEAKVTDLDKLYPAEPIADWMGVTKRTLLDLARRKKVPVMRLNERVLRFHPRTILERGLPTSGKAVR